MKYILLALISILWIPQLQAGGRSPWWLHDSSDPKSVHHGYVWHASKIEVSEKSIRLLKEQDGKLVPFFESRNVKTIADGKQQIEWAPSACVPVEDGGYVLFEAVSSVRFEKRNDASICILRGISVDLGTVTDAAGIRRLEYYISHGLEPVALP